MYESRPSAPTDIESVITVRPPTETYPQAEYHQSKAMCDRFGDCSNDGTCQLVLRNRATGMELVEYHCQAHLVLRVWEVEQSGEFDVLDARRLDGNGSCHDPESTGPTDPHPADGPQLQ